MGEQMTLFDMGLERSWQYDEDNGDVLCRCPHCGGRMLIGLYTYWNPYHYCPYCGAKLAEGKITDKRCKVYGTYRETENRVRRECGK